MAFAIIQLSDIHLKADVSANPILNRIDKIAAAARAACIGVNGLVVIVSGDSVYSGKTEEYAHARRLLHNLRDTLADSTGSNAIPIIVIPGNHDCDFTLDDKVRRMVREQIDPADLDEAVIDKCTEVQKYYREFLAELNTDDLLTPTSIAERLYKRVEVHVGLHSILFHLFNSAWVSEIHEKPGMLAFPIRPFQDAIAAPSSSTLSVSLIHHPFNWYEPNNARDIRSCIEDYSDIILTGHEHVSGAYAKVSDTGVNNEYLEGGVLQESSDDSISAFNVVKVDPDGAQQQTIRFRWNGTDYEANVAPVWRPFSRNRRLASPAFAFTNQFGRFLDDPGAGYVHPQKVQLRLGDLFVYPDLRETRFDKDSTDQKHVRGADFIDYLFENEKVLVIGDDKGGKTSLSKVLMRDAHSRGRVPILLEGGQLGKCTDDAKMEKAVALQLEEQFGQGLATKFWQLPARDRVAIVDDFHKVHGNRVLKDKVAELLAQRFGVVVLLGGDDYSIRDLISTSKDDTCLWQFKHCRIMPFGHVLRNELIGRWCRLGREFADEEEVLERRIITVSNQISAVFRLDYVPSVPIFILILLQQLETTGRATTSSGSFGYLYEVLVTATLSRTKASAFDLDWKYNYLSELAYHLFSTDNRSLPADHVMHWHQAYCNQYQLTLHFDDLFTELNNTGVVERKHGEYRFRYKYLYYFFVGRYFRDHIGEMEIQQHINELCTQLHKEEAANILIFLCHLSKDERVIGAMLAAANSIFEDGTEFDVAKVGAIPTDSQSSVLALPGSDSVENRRKALEQKDRYEERQIARRREEEEAEKEEEPGSLELAAAHKTIEILGQVLRNFAGSLKAEPKKALVNSCFSLGLRLLGEVMIVLDHPVFVDVIKSLLSKSKQKKKRKKELPNLEDARLADARLDDAVTGIIENIKQTVTFAIVKHVSESVGSEKVAQTLLEVIRVSSNESVKLIDLSIRLDHFTEFPEREIDNLCKEFSSNYFAKELIRHMVWYHLYLYPVDRIQKQRVCTKLEISVLGQTKILTSPVKQSERPRKSSRRQRGKKR